MFPPRPLLSSAMFLINILIVLGYGVPLVYMYIRIVDIWGGICVFLSLCDNLHPCGSYVIEFLRTDRHASSLLVSSKLFIWVVVAVVVTLVVVRNKGKCYSKSRRIYYIKQQETCLIPIMRPCPL